MSPDARYTAFNILVSWQNASATLDQILEQHDETVSLLSRKDRRLCNALVFGVLRQREAIDWRIRAFSNARLEKIRPKALYLLRMGIFQMAFMDRVPDFAAINSSVEIGKKELGAKAAGFINAVLRRAGREYETIPLPDPDKDPVDFFAVRYALPRWLAHRWLIAYGREALEPLCRQINSVPMLTVRTNTLKIDRPTLAEHLKDVARTVSLTPFSSLGVQICGLDTQIHELDAFGNGWFQVQDEAAQMVTELLDPLPGETVLDACAGMGGKTGHIAQAMGNRGRVTAVDTDPAKLDRLAHEAQRLGIRIIDTRTADIMKTTVKDFDHYFDRVLVDAPCTGLGVIRRNPDIKWKRTMADIQRMAGRQKKILNAGANLVRPGGILVYAVCSCEPEENQGVIQAFLNKRKDFSIDKIDGSDTICSLQTKDGFLRTHPAPHDMDGFFAARLKRKLRQ